MVVVCYRHKISVEGCRSPGSRARDFRAPIDLRAGTRLAIVEAARRSGSLITARLAGEQGREVFAVPGSALDPRAEGTNGLLKQGAILVTKAADVIAVLEPTPGRGLEPPPAREPAPWRRAHPSQTKTSAAASSAYSARPRLH